MVATFVATKSCTCSSVCKGEKEKEKKQMRDYVLTSSSPVVLFTNPSSIPNRSTALLFLCFLCLLSAKLSSNSNNGSKEITIDTGKSGEIQATVLLHPLLEGECCLTYTILVGILKQLSSAHITILITFCLRLHIHYQRAFV
ncbi:hypothetical protein ACMD2_11211 [Ananas comosus]|uniref:Uncharacterized protein n=1 Tax=Ananas comosus TaxID=4615 RepID=A0A199UMM5_ANACO|nr:hypothetical protein ACMD2_11211 [Ananas comosus]